MLFNLIGEQILRAGGPMFQRMNQAAALDVLTNAIPAGRRSSSELGRDAGIGRVELRAGRANDGDDGYGNAGAKPVAS